MAAALETCSDGCGARDVQRWLRRRPVSGESRDELAPARSVVSFGDSHQTDCSWLVHDSRGTDTLCAVSEGKVKPAADTSALMSRCRDATRLRRSSLSYFSRNHFASASVDRCARGACPHDLRFTALAAGHLPCCRSFTRLGTGGGDLTVTPREKNPNWRARKSGLEASSNSASRMQSATSLLKLSPLAERQNGHRFERNRGWIAWASTSLEDARTKATAHPLTPSSKP